MVKPYLYLRIRMSRKELIVRAVSAFLYGRSSLPELAQKIREQVEQAEKLE